MMRSSVLCVSAARFFSCRVAASGSSSVTSVPANIVGAAGGKQREGRSGRAFRHRSLRARSPAAPRAMLRRPCPARSSSLLESRGPAASCSTKGGGARRLVAARRRQQLWGYCRAAAAPRGLRSCQQRGGRVDRQAGRPAWKGAAHRPWRWSRASRAKGPRPRQSAAGWPRPACPKPAPRARTPHARTCAPGPGGGGRGQRAVGHLPPPPPPPLLLLLLWRCCCCCCRKGTLLRRSCSRPAKAEAARPLDRSSDATGAA
jgi:hypothetical protein